MTFILCVVLIISLMGCSIGEKKKCKDTVELFLTAYQKKDTKCGEYLSDNEGEETVKFQGIQGIMAESITFQTESVDMGDKVNTVNVVIKNKDFSQVVEKIIQKKKDEILSSEDVKNIIIENLKQKDAPSRKFKVPIKLDKEGKIHMTSELSNALLGGYPEYIYELTTRGNSRDK